MIEELEEILNDGSDALELNKIKHRQLGHGVEIVYTNSSEAPELTFEMLKSLSDYFGTVEIDVDNSINEPGYCDTCDWGSRYGYSIQIYKITKNFPEDLK